MTHFKHTNQDGTRVTMGTNEYIEEQFNIAKNDITVFCGDNIRNNTIAAYRKAMDLVMVGFDHSLVLNTSTNQRWALREARALNPVVIGDDPNEHLVTVKGFACGDLCNHFDQIKSLIERHNMKLLIINSWEFTSSTPRYKDKLLFQLRCLIEQYDISILIYAERTNISSNDVGRTTRGALGKLSAVAAKIMHVDTDETRMAERGKSDVSDIVSMPKAIPPKPEKSTKYVGTDGKIPQVITAKPKKENFLPWKKEYTQKPKQPTEVFVKERELEMA